MFGWLQIALGVKIMVGLYAAVPKLARIYDAIIRHGAPLPDGSDLGLLLETTLEAGGALLQILSGVLLVARRRGAWSSTVAFAALLLTAVAAGGAHGLHDRHR